MHFMILIFYRMDNEVHIKIVELLLKNCREKKNNVLNKIKKKSMEKSHIPLSKPRKKKFLVVGPNRTSFGG